MPLYQILQILQTEQAGFTPITDLSYLRDACNQKVFSAVCLVEENKIISRKFIAFWLLEILFCCQDENTWETEIKRKRNYYSILCNTYTFVFGVIGPVLGSSTQENLEILESSDDQPGWLKSWTSWCAETLKKNQFVHLSKKKLQRELRLQLLVWRVERRCV